MDISIDPLVSVCMFAYNHESYIQKAIEGVLMQQCKFKYELVVGEDASKDNTRKIIQQFQHQYPNILKPLYRERNIGMISNWRDTMQSCNGKYIALLDGDDYWTDPYKLQKQIEFLETNEDYGLVHGDINFYYDETGKWKLNANRGLKNNNHIQNKDTLFTYLIDGSYKIFTATVLFRKELLNNRKPDALDFLMEDTPMWLDFSQMTKFKYFDEVFAVYRISSDSASRPKKIKQLSRFYLSKTEMRIYYSKKHEYPIITSLGKRYNNALLNYMIYDKDYKEMYPLVNGSIIERFKYRAIKINIIREFIRRYLKFRYRVGALLR